MIVGINIRGLDVKREDCVGFFCRHPATFPTNKFVGWVIGLAPTDESVGCLGCSWVSHGLNHWLGVVKLSEEVPCPKTTTIVSKRWISIPKQLNK